MFMREGTVFNSDHSEQLYSHAEVVKVIDSVLQGIRADAMRCLSDRANTDQQAELRSDERAPTSNRTALRPLHLLTKKQQEVLYYLARGLTAKEIAYQMNRSPKTVAAHKAQILERLGIRDLAGLIVFAIKQGIVDIGDY